jgi:hypothetical protein
MKQWNLGLSLAAGLLGGILSHYAFTPSIVHAQAQNTPAAPAVPQEIRAQRFVLMNEKGEVGGIIGFDTQGAPTIRLYHDGEETYYAGAGWKRRLAQLSPAREIRAQRFVLMNASGEPEGIIGFDKQENPSIELFHKGWEFFHAGGPPLRPLGH